MKKQVKIKIVSAQTMTDGDMFEAEDNSQQNENKIEVSNTGTMSYENGKYVLEYEETELTGMPDTVTRLEFDENERDKFMMNRGGQTTGTMFFCPGERYVTTYEIGTMVLQLGMSTSALKNTVDWFGGRVHIEYDLEMNGMCTEHTVMDIEIS